MHTTTCPACHTPTTYEPGAHTVGCLNPRCRILEYYPQPHAPRTTNAPEAQHA